MRKEGILLLCLFLVVSVFAQEKAAKSDLLEARFVGVVKPMEDADGVRWMKDINKLASYSHGAPDDVSKIKEELNELKLTTPIDAPQRNHSSRASDPEIGTNFLGNSVVNSTPPDNCMAISNGGKIISSDNSTIAFYNDNGSGIMLNESHEDWFDDVAPSMSVTSGLFDPRVLYDPVEDRFIFVILHGSNASSSKCIISFSQTNNPAGNWNVYEVTGNPLNDNSWFDYPNIGINEHGLFISANLFYSFGGFNQSVVYQFNKQAGYNGNTLNYIIHSNIPSGQIGAFTLVPASHGQEDEYGPEMYFVSSSSSGSTRLNLYKITDALGNSPDLELESSIIVAQYTASADALQLGNSEQLRTNDARMQHAFYLNGIVHAVHHGNHSGGYTGIKYYRIPVADPSTTQSATYGQVGFDFAFPSMASFGLEENDQSVMIGFLNSGSTIYPEMRVVNCDNLMEWSDDVLIREGDSYINHSWVNGYERWGDYSDMQRKHNASSPEVWMAGCFGPTSHVWNTWIAEIKGDYEPAPKPIVDFVGDTTFGYDPHVVQFIDSTENDPTSWSWSFEGGNPSASSQQHPQITYYDTGYFDVTLIATNAFGMDTLIKEDYIYVKSSDTIPDTPEAVVEIQSTQLETTVYPNPSQRYELVHVDVDNKEWSHVTMNLVDLQGKLVKVMYDDALSPGLHRLTFNKLALSPGQYFLQVNRDGKMVQNEAIIVQ